MRRMKIAVGPVTLTVALLDTPTAQAIWDAAPFSGRANLWGEEVYFSTPVSVARETNARDVMKKGEIAFWTDGDAIALVWGRTPVSRGSEMRLASPCNVWATTTDDMSALKAVRSGATIEVARLPD